MTTVFGSRSATLAGGPRPAEGRPGALEAALEDLLARAFGSGGSDATNPLESDRVAIVPDAHYPFHPTTGAIADPAVVAALAAVVEERHGADVAVVGSSTEYVDADRCGRYLGYEEALSGLEATWVGPEDGSTVRRTVRVDGDAIGVVHPAALEDRAVVVVPSLRPDEAGRIGGSMRTLATLVSTDVTDDDVAAVAATRAIDPAGAVLDATTAFAGEPYAAGALLAGEPAAVDAVGASAIGRDPSDDAAISLAANDGLSVTVDGLDFGALEADCPDGELPPSDRTHPAVAGAYRLYATVAGDAVPPQMEGGR